MSFTSVGLIAGVFGSKRLDIRFHASPPPPLGKPLNFINHRIPGHRGRQNRVHLYDQTINLLIRVVHEYIVPFWRLGSFPSLDLIQKISSDLVRETRRRLELEGGFLSALAVELVDAADMALVQQSNSVICLALS